MVRARPTSSSRPSVADLRPGRALDLAAGEGRNAIWLAEHGWEVTAVDFSLVGLDKARRIEAAQPRRSGPAHRLGHADVLELRPGPVGFDLAVLAYLQLPADERRTAVRTRSTRSRAGGTLLVVAHDSTNLIEGTGGPQDPAVLYTAEEVLGDLDGERSRWSARSASPVKSVRPGSEHKHRAEPTRTAYDALVRLVRSRLTEAAVRNGCRRRLQP